MASDCPHRFRPGDRVVLNRGVPPNHHYPALSGSVGTVMRPRAWLRGIDGPMVAVLWPGDDFVFWCRPHQLLPAPTQPPAASS